MPDKEIHSVLDISTAVQKFFNGMGLSKSASSQLIGETEEVRMSAISERKSNNISNTIRGKKVVFKLGGIPLSPRASLEVGQVVPQSLDKDGKDKSGTDEKIAN